ncbi:MAG: cytochrome c oxidase subunit II [Planctomycetota bacterium]|jgi:cytochrome c oxidase subunit 2
MSEPQEQPAAKKPLKGAVLIGFLVLLVGEVIILSNSGVKSPEILPEAVSTYAEGVDQLFYLILWITGFFFVLTEALLIYFCVKYRKRDGEDGKAAHTHGNHTLELAWTFIPGLILFVLAVLQTGTWGSIKYKDGFPAEEDSVVVQVMGRQYEWRFRYAGKDGKFGTTDDVTSLGEIHVPVNRNVIVKLRTRDVLHSFWVRNARLKQDLVPGQTIPQWFNIFKEGTYEIACAELCGVGHTRMKGSLVVESEDEFNAWLEKRAADFGEHDPEGDDNWKYWRD